MNISRMKVNPNFGGMLVIGNGSPLLAIRKSDGEYGDKVEIVFMDHGEVEYTFHYFKEDIETIIEYMKRWIE